MAAGLGRCLVVWMARIRQRTVKWGWFFGIAGLLSASFALSACVQSLPESVVQGPVTVRLAADDQTHRLTTESATVRELLEEAGITLGELDEVDPPLFTPLEDDLSITVVRVTEETDTVLQSVPFERKIVRNESMDSDAPPIVVQGGKAGLQQETVRIVYRNGLESERWVTEITLIEPAQDEIIMIGIGAAPGNITFSGVLAYVSDGAAVILRGLTAFPEQLNTGGPLDGRVFSLSPTGSHLLYTRISTDTTSFNNSLWVVGTGREAEPRPLEINNVLWADWNPDRISPLQISYTTALSTTLPPGWEANNDLWVGNLPLTEANPFSPEQLVEAYPATYGWWGGNYAWSPAGRYIGYSYANEIGIIDTTFSVNDDRHLPLQRFTEYNTLQDWVWVPTLSWSSDGRFLAFTNHGGDNPEALEFNSWIVDVTNGVSGQIVEQSGMWANLHWAPAQDESTSSQANSRIAFLKSNDPLNSLRSSYSLWLVDQDGSNAHQIYPPPGENSQFPREQQFMAWSPTGDEIAFVFDNALYLLNLESQEARRITQDDALTSHPTWAPYGRGIGNEASQGPPADLATPIPESFEDLLPDILP